MAIALLRMIFFTIRVEPTPRAVDPATEPAMIIVPFSSKKDFVSLLTYDTESETHYNGFN